MFVVLCFARHTVKDDEVVLRDLPAFESTNQMAPMGDLKVCRRLFAAGRAMARGNVPGAKIENKLGVCMYSMYVP